MVATVLKYNDNGYKENVVYGADGVDGPPEMERS